MSLASSSHYLVSILCPSTFPSFLPFTLLGFVLYSLLDHLFGRQRWDWVENVCFLPSSLSNPVSPTITWLALSREAPDVGMLTRNTRNPFVWYWHYPLNSWGHLSTQAAMAWVSPSQVCGSCDPFWWALLFYALCIVHRQLYAQEAACRLQDAERDGKSLQRLSKEEYLKMMLPDSPPGDDRSRKVRSLWPTESLNDAIIQTF